MRLRRVIVTRCKIDADGQHRIADIPRFLEQALAHPDALIVGYPEYDSTVPMLRLYAVI